MQKLGVSGRSAVWYGANPASVIDGVTFNDPYPFPEEGWNKRKYIKTPFGMTSYSGVYVPLEDDEE